MVATMRVLCFFAVAASLVLSATAACADPPASRAALWVDVYEGEPVQFEAMLADLASVRVVYLGERHSVARHHELQLQVLEGLADRGVSLVLAMEQMEASHQAALDRYQAGEIDYEAMARETRFAERWSNAPQYRELIEAAHRRGIPVLALNASQEAIRGVARSGGVARLPAELRSQLPDEMNTDDADYARLLNTVMMVHAAVDAEQLRPMVEAQIARDEAMAEHLSRYLKSDGGRDRSALVIAGAGHVSYGLGMPQRVRRRLPEAKDRIVVLSESGDVELSPEMLAHVREIQVSHEQLRAIGRPIADYLHVIAPRQP